MGSGRTCVGDGTWGTVNATGSASRKAMSPRAGGEADKFGNRYEGAWTIRRLLDVVARHAESLTVEDLGEIARGAEFTFRRPQAVDQVHQVKRQRGSANAWSLRSLNSEGVLS